MHNTAGGEVESASALDLLGGCGLEGDGGWTGAAGEPL